MPRDIALLIVDVQVGMLAMAPPIYRGAEVLATIGRLLEAARAAGAPVIHVQHDGQEAGHPLHPDAPGWPIHPQIAPRPGERVIRKRFSDAFQETRLAESLAAWGVRRLVLAGMQTDYCVDTTCRRASSLGFEVTLVADAHTTWDASAFWPDSGDTLRAEQIIAHYNRVLADGFARVVPAAAVRFE